MAFQLKEKTEAYGIDDLRAIMAKLRAPGGCPWDREQTHESIRGNVIEEAYEVAEAIDSGDPALLREELGDLLLQVVFHAEMEQEDGGRNAFTFDDICDGIAKKLIQRHPHVFGTTNVGGVEDVLSNWDKIKSENKGETTYTERLRGVPKLLPALTQGEKISKRASKAGLEFDTSEQIIEKIWEETTELEFEIEQGFTGVEDINTNAERIADEIGDLLFSVTNLTRKLGIDAEAALRKSLDKFIRRFERVEQLCEIDMKDLTPEMRDELWTLAKETLKSV